MKVNLEEAASAIENFLTALGINNENDPELLGTGKRVAEAFYGELLDGYRASPAQILKESTASTTDGLVVLRAIPVVTICPHHLLPATGLGHVGYLPHRHVVGLGALAELLDCFAHRLALQEDIGKHVASALVEHLDAQAAGCILELMPTCVTCRGKRKTDARAVTSYFTGPKADASFRAEFWAASQAVAQIITR